MSPTTCVGNSPDIRRTATEAAMIQDAANSRAQDKMARIETFLGQLGERLIQLLQQYMTGEQVVRVVGPSAMPMWITYDKDYIEGEFDFEVEAGSTQPQNETFRRQSAMQMVDAMAPFAAAGVINVPELAKYVLQMGFGVKDPDAFINAELRPRRPPGPPEPQALPPGGRRPVAALPGLRPGDRPGGPPGLPARWAARWSSHPGWVPSRTDARTGRSRRSSSRAWATAAAPGDAPAAPAVDRSSCRLNSSRQLMAARWPVDAARAADAPFIQQVLGPVRPDAAGRPVGSAQAHHPLVSATGGRTRSSTAV